MAEPQTIIVMYHYVRPIDRQRWGGIFPLEPAAFEAQLDYLATLGDIVTPTALAAPPTSGRSRILLTFDDGTRDHYEHVFPILRRRGLSGLFGVISGPAQDGALPNVHLVHWLTSQLSDEALWERLRAAFGAAALGGAEQARIMYSRDRPLRARIKLALNFALTHDQAAGFLTEAVSALGVDPATLARAWYLTAAMIRQMHVAGMCFAIHAHRHRPYDGDARAYFDSELAPCERWLTRLLGTRPALCIAAFGGSNLRGAGLAALADELRARGYQHGFLTQRGTEPLVPRNFFLKRLDCADLPQTAAALAPAAT